MKNQKLLTLFAVMAAMAVLAATPAMADLAPGVTLDFNANDPASGVDSSNWLSATADQTHNWTGMGGDVTLETVSSGYAIDKAYRFTGGSGATAGSWDAYAENTDTTWEIWVKPAGTGSDNNQVIFETGGGGDGMAIWYDLGAGTINLIIDNGSTQRTVSAPIGTSEFSHVVFVYDKDLDGNDLMQLWVDGVLADEVHDTDSLNDWAGGDGATLGSNGGIANNMTGGNFNGDLSVLRFWESKALTPTEITDNFDLYSAGAEIVYPANGEVVPPGDVTLQWINVDANGLDVDVETWWGTDPNRLNTGAYALAGAGVNLTSATVSPPGPGIYYWYVDNFVPGGDPCEFYGRVNMFTNDGPIELVDVGPDMVTWEGEPVDLVANVTDDGGSALTYAWSSPLPNGVTAAYNPDTSSQATAVTFAFEPYTTANIQNPGFDDLAGWTITGFHGTRDIDGNTVLWVNNGVSASQVLDETVQTDATYTLSVDVGFDVQWGVNARYRVQLLAGEFVIAEDDDTLSPTPGGAFETSVINYVAEPNKIGLPLRVKLECTSTEDPSSDVNFDNVILTTDTPFPAPDYATVDVTATVQDLTNPAVSDTLTIEVYSDECLAARFGLDLDKDTDYNKNCLVNSEDLETMALAWLDDTSQTQAAVNPTQPDGGFVVNGEFAMYKPGTDIPVVSWGPAGYDIWVNTIGYNRPLSGGGFVTFADGTTGTVVDIPGWDTPVAFDGAAATNACDLFSSGFDDTDGTSTLNAFGAWSGQNGTLAQSADPIALPIRGTENVDAVYTLSAMSLGNPEPKTFSLIVDGNEITPTTSVDPVDTGSWQVISRTYDSNSIPADGDVKILVGTKRPDPDVGNPDLTGTRWRVDNITLDYEVTNPALPSVDAGPDMVTWIGEPVTLAPTVVNNDPGDPQAALNYQWTADAPEWLDVAISDPSAEAPTVTINRVVPYFWEIPIADSSFEGYTMSPDGQMKWFYSSQSLWRFADPDGTVPEADPLGQGYFGQLFLWNPKPGTDVANWNRAGFDGIVADGDNSVIVGSILRYDGDSSTGSAEDAASQPGGLAKLLVTDSENGDGNVYPTYDPSASYELSAYIGYTPVTFSRYYGYRVELLAGGENVRSSDQYTDKVVGGTVLGSVESTDPIDPNTWIQVTVPVGPDPANADLAGEPLQIRFTSLKDPDDPNTMYIHVDDVTLTTDAPPALEPVKLQLAVNNEGSTTVVNDSMTIDLYETPCDVTTAVFPETIDQTDHTINCITNLADYAVLAKDWLEDYALTQPEPAPTP